MLYQFVKPLARWILGWNFRRIYISGKNKIPEKGPVILACNHPTAFIEPCVLASFQKRPLHFLVRGDFFKQKIFSFFLRVLHMIPIYRMKDGGYSKVKTNLNSFERCYDALKEGKTLMILSEGFCIHEKRLRPIRKGTARIAFGALEKYALSELLIFPIGVNYTDVDNYRSDMMINIGEPIAMKDFVAIYEKDKIEAVRLLTEEISEGLEKNVIHIEADQSVEVIEKIWSLWRNDNLHPFEELISDSSERLQKEKAISDHFNQLSPDAKIEISSKVNSYFQQLEKRNLDDLALAESAGKNKPFIFLLFGFPFFLLGAILNFIPMVISYLIGKIPGMSIEFQQSIRVASALGLFLIWYLAIVIACYYINPWLSLIFCILLPLTAWLTIRYIDYYKANKKIQTARRIDKTHRKEISLQRTELLQTLFEQNLWA